MLRSMQEVRVLVIDHLTNAQLFYYLWRNLAVRLDLVHIFKYNMVTTKLFSVQYCLLHGQFRFLLKNQQNFICKLVTWDYDLN